jgi:uncharacterized protein YdeI (YjbR/CyaY-like superfamily)
MNPQVDDFFSRTTKWHDELQALRRIFLDCGLTESYKWRVPCYTHQNANVALIHGFKEYFAIAFFKGALLSDPEKVLIQQTENVQSGRQIRFTSLKEVVDQDALIKAYIFEAIEVEKAGLKVESKSTNEFEVPEELTTLLSANLKLQNAFEALTPGRQRGYLLHFAQPKQSSTRVSRIEKCIPRIMIGKGLNDCICGHSKRMPNCDGSHKFYE